MGPLRRLDYFFALPQPSAQGRKGLGMLTANRKATESWLLERKKGFQVKSLKSCNLFWKDPSGPLVPGRPLAVRPGLLIVLTRELPALAAEHRDYQVYQLELIKMPGPMCPVDKGQFFTNTKF